MVCSRAKTHFDPASYVKFDTSTAVSGSTILEAFKDDYMPLHANQQKAMYFAVRSRLPIEIVSLILQYFL
jgi:eukaryotic translation initiation factor 2C